MKRDLVNNPISEALHVAKANHESILLNQKIDILLGHLNTVGTGDGTSPEVTEMITADISALISKIMDKQLELSMLDLPNTTLLPYVTSIRDFYLEQYEDCKAIFKKYQLPIPG